MHANIKSRKIYVQPLGLLRGCSDSNGIFLRIAGGDVYFSALRIFIRNADGISEQIISVSSLDEYLQKQKSEIRSEIKDLIENISKERPTLKLKGGLVLDWHKPLIQGVLNVTPDSFSDGGKFADHERSLSHARHMISAGVDIIDVGGESTKPGAVTVSIDVEKGRVLPVIADIARLNIPISIDSRNAEVMSAAMSAGSHLINDVSALTYDQDSTKVVADGGAPVILMHAQGAPETMQDDPKYQNILLDIYDYLEARIKHCLDSGVSKNNIIVDPGIGFGKTVEHNLQIIAGLTIFHSLGVPLLLGVSRKSFIGKITGEEVAEKRISGSVAAALSCVEKGVQIIRVHDVEQTAQALDVSQALTLSQQS